MLPAVARGAATAERTLHGEVARFPGGLRELGGGLYAWLQPNGGLGESNAGLVVGEGESLLVDTLWDLNLTGRMLAAFEQLTAGAPIRRLINTHSDGDHCWGNQLLAGAEIVATRRAAEQMREESPGSVKQLLTAGKLMGLMSGHPLPMPGKRRLRTTSEYFRHAMDPYDFDGIELTFPTRTFEGRLTFEVGGREVELIEVGPAHTEGDAIVHVPDAGALFAADILFIGTTPIVWAGPVSNWIAALDRILELEPRTIVPGHGPPTDAGGVRSVRDYWTFLEAAARERHADGMPAPDAARDIVRSPQFAERPFSEWDAPERAAVNVAMLYRELEGSEGRAGARERVGLLIGMAKLAEELAGGSGR